MNADHPNAAPARRSLQDLLDVPLDEHAETLRNKREDAAIALTGLLRQAGLSRAELARRLDWKPSRVSRALSGNENLTLNTLTEIINAADMDYDLVIRHKGSCRNFQPWEQAELQADLIGKHQELCIALEEAQDKRQNAHAILQTAEAINRSLFRRAQGNWQNSTVLSGQTLMYREDEHAPLSRAA